MAKRWVIQEAWDGREAVARRWDIPPIVAQMLHARGWCEEADPRQFIVPRLADLHPPYRLPGCEKAARLIAEAVRAGRRIVLYGDYDVDGITGVAILWHMLRACGASVQYYVPHRLDEGYGLGRESVERLAAEGAEMIISVDCGISAREEAAFLRRQGVSLIITDHHALPPERPEAAATVHPLLDTDSPNPHLSGAGVAFKLAWGVAQAFVGTEKVGPEFRELLCTLLPLAALGTIADVVPLQGENRIIASRGLADLKKTPISGLAALLEGAGLDNGRVGGYDVGFKLAPRLNAAGRMGHARLAVELLTRADAARSREIAAYLELQNRQRQQMERQMTAEAVEQLEATGMAADSRRGIVVAAESWHAGVIGIVAARLVDRYRRPAVVIALNGEPSQGSARSHGGFDLYAALKRCGEHLESYGGHAAAAGLRIRPDRIDAFREAFVHVANQWLTPRDLMPRLDLEGEVALGELTPRVVDWIERMEPFGCANPRPRFASRPLRLASEPRAVGKSGTHLQASFVQEDGIHVRAIGFGLAEHLDELKARRTCRVAFEPMLNDYNGPPRVELRLLDLDFTQE